MSCGSPIPLFLYEGTCHENQETKSMQPRWNPWAFLEIKRILESCAFFWCLFAQFDFLKYGIGKACCLCIHGQLFWSTEITRKPWQLWRRAGSNSLQLCAFWWAFLTKLVILSSICVQLLGSNCYLSSYNSPCTEMSYFPQKYSSLDFLFLILHQCSTFSIFLWNNLKYIGKEG